ncbi:MAG: ATP-binding protein [Endomicrobium sp.]|jgi:predicted AAA+ superfamily ATPase|nr:ATP-binding protein [Endomicrobium sp.]
MLERTMIPVIKKNSKHFPVLLLTGMRQIGKSTLFEMLKDPGRKYVSLDSFDDRELARNNPALFIQKYEPPVIIDEVQYAPELFTYIKIYIDSHKKDRDFWLTGSQKYELMKGIQESLAGRVAILDMLGFSYKEIIKKPYESKPFIPSMEMIKLNFKAKKLMEVYKIIWEGSYPRLITHKGENRDTFYKSYLQSYIERDVRNNLNIRGNELKFHNFIRAIAIRTATLLNYADISKEIGIDQRTVKVWMSMLERSGIIKLLEPYYRNPTNSIVKTPKIYFLDTGLCSYLAKMNSPEILEAGYMDGRILETYAFIEILKSYWHNGKEPNVYFYRDKAQNEIDFIIEDGGVLYPIEVKKTAIPSKNDIKNFFLLKQFKLKVGTGVVICLRHEALPIDNNTLALPIWEI